MSNLEVLKSVAEQLMSQQNRGRAGSVDPGKAHQQQPAENGLIWTWRAEVRSHWAELRKAEPMGSAPRKGQKVVQFRDLATNKYVAVAIDGDVKIYGK